MGTPKITPFQNIEIGQFLYGKTKETHQTSQTSHGYYGELATFMIQKRPGIDWILAKHPRGPLGHCVRNLAYIGHTWPQPTQFLTKFCWSPLGCLARTQTFSDNISYRVSSDVWPTSIKFLTTYPKGLPRMFGQNPVNFWPNSSSRKVSGMGWGHLS